MSRLARWMALGAVGGVAAVLLPAILVAAGEPLLRVVVERPSLWTFHGLMIVGFILGLMGPLELVDLPPVGLAIIGPFPVIAGVRLLAGDPRIAWPREFLLYAAWLVPAMGGLLLGRAVRTLQERMRRRDD